MKIRTKLFINTSIVVISLIVIWGIFNNFYLSRVVENQFIIGDDARMRQTMKQIENYLSDIKNYSHNIAMDENIQEFLKASCNTNVDMFEKALLIEGNRKRLRRYVFLKEYLHSILIINKRGDVYTDLAYYDKSFEANEKWYSDYLKINSKEYFSEVHNVLNMAENFNSDKVFSYIIKVINLENSEEVIGELILNIKLNFFQNIINAGCNGFDGYCWTDRNGQRILFIDSEQFKPYYSWNHIESNYEIEDPLKLVKDSRGYTILSYFDSTGWILQGYMENKSILQRSDYFSVFILFLFFSLIPIAASLIPIIISIVCPIRKLTDSMKRVSEGCLDVSFSVTSKDEIGVLGNGFNEMISSLKAYIKEQIEYEKMKKWMDLELLYSQINPHFIYNTLNSIIYLTRQGKSDDVINLTNSFISILQDTVKLGREESVSTVRQEIEVINHYVCVQKIRYRDLFKIEWKIDDDILDCIIPKMILQPLIENSIIHGIFPKEEEGIIEVCIRRSNNHIKITVKDNGIGIDKDILIRISNGEAVTKKVSGMKSIGIKNIVERLNFLYNGDFTFKIKSGKDMGTEITMTLPLSTGIGQEGLSGTDCEA